MNRYTTNEKKAMVKEAEKRRKRGQSVVEIAKALNVAPTTINNWLSFGIKPKSIADVSHEEVIVLRARGCSIEEIARTLKTYPATVKNILEKKGEAIINGEKEDMSSYVRDKVFPANEVPEKLTNEEALKLFNMSPSDWIVKKLSVTNWTGMTAADENGKNGRMAQYRVAIEVRPRTGMAMSFEEMKYFAENYNFAHTVVPMEINPDESGNILLLPIADMHYNGVAYESVCGELYNCEIAEARLKSYISRAIADCKNKTISKIVLVTLGDLFHVNGAKNETANGTRQDVEKSCYDAFAEMSMRIFPEIIHTLVTTLNAPLEYVYVPGNHDADAGAYFATMMAAYYRDAENVTVDYSPKALKCKLYGKTLVAFQHGTASFKNVTDTILNDYRDLFAQAENTLYLSGHLHNSSSLRNVVSSITGISLGTFCGATPWEKNQSYSSPSVCSAFSISNTTADYAQMNYRF